MSRNSYIDSTCTCTGVTGRQRHGRENLLVVVRRVGISPLQRYYRYTCNIIIPPRSFYIKPDLNFPTLDEGALVHLSDHKS